MHFYFLILLTAGFKLFSEILDQKLAINYEAKVRKATADEIKLSNQATSISGTDILAFHCYKIRTCMQLLELYFGIIN